jgi:toxin ParE1/3/4
VRRLVFLADARDDLADISMYIAGESGSTKVAFSFVEKIVEHCGRLASLPGTLGTARPELRTDLRSISHQSYVILFRYIEDRVEIVSVVNGQRDYARLFDS